MYHMVHSLFYIIIQTNSYFFYHSLKASDVIPPSSNLIALAFDASTMVVPSSNTTYSSAPSMEFCSKQVYLSLLMLRRAPSLLNRKGRLKKELANNSFIFYVRIVFFVLK